MQKFSNFQNIPNKFLSDASLEACNNPPDSAVTACAAFDNVHYSVKNYTQMSSTIGPFGNGQYALFSTPGASQTQQYKHLDNVVHSKTVVNASHSRSSENYGCGSCGGGLQTVDKNLYAADPTPILLRNYEQCNSNSECASQYCRQYYTPSINPRNQPNFGICADVE